MSTWVSRSVPFVLIVSIATLYQSMVTPFGWGFVRSVALLFFYGLLIVTSVKFIIRHTSAKDMLNGFVSAAIGCAGTLFFLFCSERMFQDAVPDSGVTPGWHLLLLFTLSAISFYSLRAFAFFKPEADSAAALRSELSSGRKFIPDQSALEDGRIIDLARTGLFDGQIIVPGFLPTDLRQLAENGDETVRTRAKKALDALRRLESLPRLSLLSKEVRASGDLNEKILASAKALNACLLTNEVPSCKTEQEQALYLSVDTIANALRPPIPKGEVLAIKIQRLGKEPKQGIGYLEDGTMVVVNGGGDYLGRSVRTQVLSQKYSSSGKIIFCNVREEDGEDRSGTVPYSHADVHYCAPTSYTQTL
jgi:hypothetical protein